MTSRGQFLLADMPWMAKSTVHAVLNSDLPYKSAGPTDPADEEEDPMLLMKKQKKLKKVGQLICAYQDAVGKTC